MPITILGIRHHGVGSAKNVLEMLEQIQPDMVLVEGPPELDNMTHWIGHKDLKAPVAVLGYNTDDPKQATFYPFAEFSPEWQAIAYANSKQIPVRMMDLPLKEAPPAPSRGAIDDDEAPPLGDGGLGLDLFSQIGGYSDHELWWEQQFEQKYIKNNAHEHFEAVMLMMSELRTAPPAPRGVPSEGGS